MKKFAAVAFLLMAAVGCGSQEDKRLQNDVYYKTVGPGDVDQRGAPGINGTNGTNGKDGVNGTNGAAGASGSNGVDGTNGKDGATGATGATGAQGPAGTNYTPPVVDAEQSAINATVGQYNQNRLFAGQEEIDPGLSCTVSKFGTVAVPEQPASIAQAISGGTWTTYNILTYTYVGNFDQPNVPVTNGMNIFPTQVQQNPNYQSWYMVNCTGYIVITQDNQYEYDLSSDDGSILTVNGVVVNNDGLHGVSTVSGSVTLDTGVYSFRLQYLQAGGNEALILNQNGVVLDGAYLYH